MRFITIKIVYHWPIIKANHKGLSRKMCKSNQIMEQLHFHKKVTHHHHRACIDMRGVCFPAGPGGSKPSTTHTGREILGAAMASAPNGDASKARLLAVKSKAYRHTYMSHQIEVSRLMASSAKVAQDVATGGLDQAYESFVFNYGDARGVVPLRSAMEPEQRLASSRQFSTGVVQGQSKVEIHKMPIEVPFEGATYTNGGVCDLMEKMVWRGEMESTVLQAVRAVVEQHDHASKHGQDWCDLRGKAFVLFGATSEMGPLHFLLEHGAIVIAIARQSSTPTKWKRLIAHAK